MIIIKKEKIVHGIKIVINRDYFLKDKNRFERTEQLWFSVMVLLTNVNMTTRRRAFSERLMLYTAKLAE